jgi:hypothetical protein
MTPSVEAVALGTSLSFSEYGIDALHFRHAFDNS